MSKVIGSSGLITTALHHHQHRSQIRAASVTRVSFPAMKRKGTVLSGGFFGQRIGGGGEILATKRRTPPPVSAQMTAGIIGRSHKWWEKGIQPNMREVTSAQDLVESLTKAGNKLVVLEFFSPGCGGCKALHPKIRQLAEQNPDVLFLQLNHEEHKSLAYSLGVHVLPFFRFYRGAQGRLCSFSCTNATIKKFKDALAKHSTDRCSLGPAKGLEEKELLALAANRDLGFSYIPTTSPLEPDVLPIHADSETPSETMAPSKSNDVPLPLPLPLVGKYRDRDQKNLVNAERLVYIISTVLLYPTATVYSLAILCGLCWLSLVTSYEGFWYICKKPFQLVIEDHFCSQCKLLMSFELTRKFILLMSILSNFMKLLCQHLHSNGELD